MEKAYLVPTFHHDIAYLKPENEYTAACMKILDEALYILENNPEYCFFMEQAWLLEEYWDARPEKREQMRLFVKEGRFRIEPGLYAVPDMNLLDGESLFMQAKIGRNIAMRTLGAKPRLCMIADCWGHHAQLPQILTQCGYEYYAFSRCMRHDVDVQNFVWQGADGSRIRAHWMSTHYEGVGFPSASHKENAAELDWADAGMEGISALMQKNREKCALDPQYLPVGGDMNFPSREAPALVKKINAKKEIPELVFSTPAEMLDKIDWAAKPVATGEFESSMQGTFATNIYIKLQDRRYAGELYALEALCAVLDADENFEEAWKLHLKNQFHDIICGTICDRAIRDVDADFRALGHMLAAIRRRMTAAAGEKAYFNALPFERSVNIAEGTLTLPALGFAPAKNAVKAEKVARTLPCTFENAFYRAEIGKDGYISSLVLRSADRELVKKGDVPFGALVMQMDNGDSWWEFSAPNLTRVTQAYTLNRPDPLRQDGGRVFLPDIESAEIVDSDEQTLTVRQTGSIEFWVTKVKFVTEMTFSALSPAVHVKTSFTNEAKNIRLRVAVPTDGLTEARRQIPYACVSFGEGEQACQRFADLRDGTSGLALLNRGTPAYSVDGDMLLMSLFRSVAMEYKCESTLSYGLGRAYSFEYAYLPHDAQDDDVLWREALSLNVAPVACTLPEKSLHLSVKGAYLSAVRKTDFGLFARAYNPLTAAKECVVCAEGMTRAFLTDGLGEKQTEIPVKEGKAVVPLDARRVQGILLTKE